jgi:hypothetical protein
MEEIKSKLVPMFYIEYYKPNTGKLIDISEEGYPTLEICNARIRCENKQDEEFKQELLEKYEQDLRNFVLDLDTSDREPVNPLDACWRYDKKPQLYYKSEKGFTKVEKHVIKNLADLQADAETIEIVNGILSGSIRPRNYSNVRDWMKKCYQEPNTDELKMCAINQVLTGYGIESVCTSKWKNGYWCDILCAYVNMGDSYISTVIHHRKHGFMVASIGDVIEKNKHVI